MTENEHFIPIPADNPILDPTLTKEMSQDFIHCDSLRIFGSWRLMNHDKTVFTKCEKLVGCNQDSVEVQLEVKVKLQIRFL